MLSVLYVDDERDLLELGKIFLEQSPEFRVAISPSANDALASPAFSSYDAIVSDYQMPEMDGRMWSSRPSTTVLTFTSRKAVR
jgi:CheY-like chemotaxis protein